MKSLAFLFLNHITVYELFLPMYGNILNSDFYLHFSFFKIFLICLYPNAGRCNKYDLSLKLNNSIGNRIFFFRDYILATLYFLLLALVLSLVLQHGHEFSSVKKNNAHSEHHFCPILYRKLFVNDVDFRRSHNPRHICTMNLLSQIYI